jgi:hypothetical protein
MLHTHDEVLMLVAADEILMLVAADEILMLVAADEMPSAQMMSSAISSAIRYRAADPVPATG